MAHDVSVKIGSENSALDTGLAKAKHAVEGFKEHASESFKEVGKELLGVFAVGAIIEGIHSLIEEFSQLADTASRLDTTAESLQRIAYAAKLSGTDLQTVTKGLEKVTITAQEALEGNEGLADAFEKLGINAASFIDLSPEEKLLALSKATEEAEHSSAELGRAYKEVLGKAAGELLPLLKEGPEGLKELFSSATVASNEAVAKLKEDGDKIEGVWMSFKAAAVTAIGFVIDSVQVLWAALNTIGTFLAELPNGFKAATEAADDFSKEWFAKREKEKEARNKPKPKTDIEGLIAKADKKDDEEKKAAEELAKLQDENFKKEHEAYLRSLSLLERKRELQRDLLNLDLQAAGTTSDVEKEKIKGKQLDVKNELSNVDKDIAREDEKKQKEQVELAKKSAQEKAKAEIDGKKKALKDAEKNLSGLEKLKDSTISVDQLRSIGGGLAGANYKVDTAKNDLQRQQVDYAKQQVEKLTQVIATLEAAQKPTPSLGFDAGFPDS